MRYEKSFTLGSGDSGRVLAETLKAQALRFNVTEAEAIRIAIRTLAKARNKDVITGDGTAIPENSDK